MTTRARLRELFPDARDRQIAAAKAADLRQRGMSESDIAQWLVIGRDINERLGDGRLTDDGVWAFGQRRAEELGLPREQILTVGEIPMDIPLAGTEPSAAEDAATIERVEGAMKKDLAAYQKDAALQLAYADALDRQEERKAIDDKPLGTADLRSSGRRAEIEAKMYDSRGNPDAAYWKNEALQLEYRSLAAPDGAAATSGTDAGNTTEE